MEPDEAKRIFKSGYIPIPKGQWYSHYEVAIRFLVLALAMFITIVIWGFQWFSVIFLTITLGISLLVFLYTGKRQLRIRKISGPYASNEEAYQAAKEVCNELTWEITEQIDNLYVCAFAKQDILHRAFIGGGEGILIFIDQNTIWAGSILLPKSVGTILGFRNNDHMTLLINNLRTKRSS